MNRDVGTAIKDAFEFLMANFNDTSRMLTIIEEYMKNKGLVSETGAVAAWGRSKAYYGSWGWMPHYLFRSYHILDKEKGSKGKLRVFFAVYFVPVNFKYPIFICGATRLDKDVGINKWAKGVIANEGPAFTDNNQVNSWLEAPEDKKRHVKTMFYTVKPLTEVSSQPYVVDICEDALERMNAL